MARFDRLSFSKDWRNPADFATYEGEETKVREDMQFLYNEIRDFLNNLIGGIETMAVPGTGDFKADGSVTATGDFHQGGYRVTQVGAPTEDTDAANKQYVDATVVAAAQERVPQTSFDAHLADTNNPHGVRSEHIAVSAALSEKLGLQTPAFVEDAISDVADDVAGLLSSIAGTPATHRWKMFQWAAVGESATLKTTGDDSSYGFYIRTSDSITFGEDGTVSLVNPTEVGKVKALPAAGVYFQYQLNNVWQPMVYRVLNSSSVGTTTYVNGTTGLWAYDELRWEGLEKQVSYERYLGVISSDDADAYPDDGFVDSIHYVEETTLTTKVAQIQSDFYIGTGKYGESNPTKLEFTFAPKVIAVFDSLGQVCYAYNSSGSDYFLHTDVLTTEYTKFINNGGPSSSYYHWGVKKSEDGKTIYFYVYQTSYNYDSGHTVLDSSAAQCNTLNEKYYFVGIG